MTSRHDTAPAAAPERETPAAGTGAAAGTPDAPAPLGALLAPVRTRVAAATALQGLAGALGLVPLICVAEIAGALLAPGGPDTGPLWTLVVAAVAGAVAALAAGAASTVVGHLADNDLQLSVRRSLARRVARVPLGWFAGRGSGRVKKALHDDISDVHSLVAHTLPDLAAVVAVPVVALVYLAAVDWRLTLVAVALVIGGAALFARAMAGSTAKMARYVAAMGAVNSAAVEFVDGIQVVKHFGHHRRAHQRFTAAADDFADFFVSWTRSTTPVAVGSFLLLSAPTVTVTTVGAGALFAFLGWSEPVSIVAFALLAPALCAPMSAIGQSVQQIQAARAAAERVAGVLAAPVLPEGGAPAPESARVVFSGVRFAYPRPEGAPGEEEALRGVDLVLEPGTVTALVGPSGAGKSTLAALLARFHDVTAGSITIGGTDVRDLATAELYRTVGFVFQDTRLLRETVAANIAMGRPGATREEVAAAARAARIADRIERLPRGYDSVVGEDAELSGGEAQRVAIARALLADTPVLVLDEATAAVDPEAEESIQDALSELARGRTVLVVAHRLRTVAGADRIAVLDAGRLAEIGTHADLLARGGRYAALWRAQQGEGTDGPEGSGRPDQAARTGHPPTDPGRPDADRPDDPDNPDEPDTPDESDRQGADR
ncbi:ABC transporter ATP-binding protein/permease [Streptomonospora sp. S1-112]|uniref:ABC transporter ATP-binding protein/permease n=1 Tax=Streptomonospora mangrovi TaxID=2883123 RepID=A0A9X3SII4_9ACTN|nr:ABC transporter ATP-binding protein [Streptomonospora mangrovi]MDA0566294.1 ABC transporter ATP-binding protein/permease [Streptomonospora mangrovi]